MTQSEFHNLSIEAQEEFINSGNTFDVDSSLNNKEVPSSLIVNDTESTSEVATKPLNNAQICGSLISDAVVLQSSHTSDKLAGTEVEQLSDVSVPLAKESVDSPSVSVLTPTFDFDDPVELLILLDDNVRSGKVTLHDWQIRFLLDFATSGESERFPFQALMRACNGSGKDKFIIAPSVVWLLMKNFRARGVVTSSSGVQLDNQTCAYISQLAKEANTKWGTIWKCNYRYYECLPTQSPCICYATDEPGKAEGFHPLEYGAKMGIFVSEDKSVPDDINIALNKCTGYTHRIHVSTPGNAMGHFYDMCSVAVDRDSIKSPLDVKPEDYIHYHVTAKNCPHLSSSYMKQMIRDLPGGEFGAAYKSQVLAEFATTDEMVVIPYTYIWKAKKKNDDTWIKEEFNKGGLDLSDGGDETVLVVRNGNKVINVVPFKFDNTEDTIEFLNEKFKENGLVNKDAYIFADCGGLGKPMLDRMKRQGWSNIRYVDNRARTTRPKTYKNYGAEIWFNFSALLKQDELILIDDPKLVRQLSVRYYKIIDGAVHQLLSKLEMRSRGYPSPDRADACVLAFTDYKSTFVESVDKEKEKPFEVVEEEVKDVGHLDLRVQESFGQKGWNRKYNVNGGVKDFRELQDEVSYYNQKLIESR